MEKNQLANHNICKHCKSITPKLGFLLQGMTNKGKFTLSLGDTTTHAVLHSVPEPRQIGSVTISNHI